MEERMAHQPASHQLDGIRERYLASPLDLDHGPGDPSAEVRLDRSRKRPGARDGKIRLQLGNVPRPPVAEKRAAEAG
jgi:hypothetical protein